MRTFSAVSPNPWPDALALVGRTDPLFADDAVARLQKVSLGLPRALNNAAKKAVAELTRD